jgi:hypothetical protein
MDVQAMIIRYRPSYQNVITNVKELQNQVDEHEPGLAIGCPVQYIMIQYSMPCHTTTTTTTTITTMTVVSDTTNPDMYPTATFIQV